MRQFWFIICLIAASSAHLLAADYTYVWDVNCKNAYQQYMALHMKEGDAWIYREVTSDPHNLLVTYTSDYNDCLTLLFTGDPDAYRQRHSHIDERLSLMEKGDEHSPWYRFCRSGIYLHWALVYVRMGENFKATTAFRRSYILIKENQRLFPDFEPNNIYLGADLAAAGAIPDNYKWLASIFGVSGNIHEGVGMLTSYLARHTVADPLYEETECLYAYLKFYLLSQQEEVWSFVNSNRYTSQNNLTLSFIRANLALNYRKANAAIETLGEMAKDKDYGNYSIFDFEMGCALQMKLDPLAIKYLQHFVANYKGGIFIKDAWMKMALQYYLQNNTEQAAYCKAHVQQVGNAQIDVDKQAQRTSQNGSWPDVRLLRARLLFDGGYYQQSLDVLKTITYNGLARLADKEEYLFRMGRVYDEMDNDDLALNYYKQTLDIGKDHKEYFAARAALQTAFIYEHHGRRQQALDTYRYILEMPEHDMRNSIDQQAKAGINRLTVK